MLSAEKIQSNWDRYLNEIRTNISKERSDILLPFLNKFDLIYQYAIVNHLVDSIHLLVGPSCLNHGIKQQNAFLKLYM